MIKVYKYFFITSLLISFSSCSEDENRVDTPTTPTTTPVVVTPPTTDVVVVDPDPDIDIDPIVLPNTDLDPDAAPATNFDLSNWNLSIPVFNGLVATTISVAEINDDYTNPTYFYTGTDGAMVFKNFILGAKTSINTSYTRSELREMLRGTNTSIDTKGINENNWVFGSSDTDTKADAGAVDGELTATLKIDHVTTTGSNPKHIGRVIIGQIHASSDEPCRLYYRKLPNNTKGSIYFAHEPNELTTTLDEEWHEMIGSRSDSQSDSFDGIELGEVFSYSIKVVDNDLTVTIIREGKDDVIETIDMTNSGFANDWMYFKAGVYSQNNTGEDDDYDQVSFYELNVTH